VALIFSFDQLAEVLLSPRAMWYNRLPPWKPWYYACCASTCTVRKARYCFTNPVRPSVRSSRGGIVSKRMHISPNSFYLLVGAP